MSELKQIIGKNLSELRKKKKLTQAELAVKLNYSDKAISKWEHGDALPSIENLVEICNFYGITLDQLTHEGAEQLNTISESNINKTNKLIITLLSVVTIFLIATVIYVGFSLFTSVFHWIVFVWAIPLSLIVLIVFNSIWGIRKMNFLLVTIFIWTFIAAIYLTCLLKGYNFWPIFILGVPATVIVILWSRIKRL